MKGKWCRWVAFGNVGDVRLQKVICFHATSTTTSDRWPYHDEAVGEFKVTRTMPPLWPPPLTISYKPRGASDGEGMWA